MEYIFRKVQYMYVLLTIIFVFLSPLDKLKGEIASEYMIWIQQDSGVVLEKDFF